MKYNMHQYNERLKELIEANAPMKQMVYELKVPFYAIKNHIEYWFDIKKIVTVRKKPLPKNQILIDNESEVMKLHQQGISNMIIAQKFNSTVQQVYQFIKRRKSK